eukprot:PhM_4_TR7776/c0_g1_i1/m.98460
MSSTTAHTQETSVDWDPRDGPSPTPNDVLLWDKYVKQKQTLLRDRKYAITTDTSSGTKKQHVRVVNPFSWDAFWEAFATRYLPTLQNAETLAELAVPDAHRRLKIASYTSSSEFHTSVVATVLQFGAIDWIDDEGREIIVQMTTPSAAQAAAEHMTSEGVAVGGKSHRVQVEVLPGEDVSSLRLCFGFDVTVDDAHLSAMFGLIHADHTMVRLDGAMSSVMVTYKAIEHARAAVHVLQQPLAFDWGIRLSYTKDLLHQAKFPLEVK